MPATRNPGLLGWIESAWRDNDDRRLLRERVIDDLAAMLFEA
jgi:hypothetical protein